MIKPFALIIEDDPRLGKIYQATLGQAGYETFIDMDGDKFQAKLSNPNPALVILDMHLPFASGLDILRQLRADRRWKKVPIILATADLYLAKSMQGQAEHILIKPISVNRLGELARKILSEHIATQKTQPMDLR
ncbi:MAG: response regulator [Chloroflexi bacterium]|nr:MAG: response regulator [Chloroflexota bacterium]